MTNGRDTKNLLYNQVARLGKALARPKRLELIEILCQGEKGVEQLAAAAHNHRQTLRSHRSAETDRVGYVVVRRGRGTDAGWRSGVVVVNRRRHYRLRHGAALPELFRGGR